MGGGMVGADADALAATGRRFARSAEALRRHETHLSTIFGSLRWVGTDAALSRAEWDSVSRPALAHATAFVERLGAELLDHADQQRRSSATTADANAAPVEIRPGGAVAGHPTTGSLDDVLDAVVDERLGEAGRPAGSVGPATVTGLRPSAFAQPSDGRDAVLKAMNGFADADRIARDEIEIRALDNGRYIVVLPGVTDLSDGFDRFAERIREDGPFGLPAAGREAVDSWTDNDEPTVRKTRYAFDAALRDDETANEYSVATIRALETAGVPPGAEVMIVGHSFGAYTAMDLAADPSVNVIHDTDPTGYHVRITDVIAMGAETDWRFGEIPADTRALVLNNRLDGVYRAEDLIHPDGHARHDGHLERNFWGGWQGYGHDEHNYIDWLAGTDDDDIEAWMNAAGERYTSAGTRVSALVPDPDQRR